MSILDKDPHPFRLPKLAPNEEPELSALNPEEEAEKEFIDLVTLISIGKMIAYGYHQSPELSDESLQKSVKELQKEISLREKYAETEVVRKRKLIIQYNRDRYANEVHGHYDEVETGENILVIDDTLCQLTGDKLNEAVFKSTSFEYAFSPSFGIAHLEKELQKREAIKLGLIDIDIVETFESIPPLPSDFGILNEGDLEQIFGSFNQNLSKEVNHRLGK